MSDSADKDGPRRADHLMATALEALYDVLTQDERDAFGRLIKQRASPYIAARDALWELADAIEDTVNEKEDAGLTRFLMTTETKGSA
jgi:hypothetical protein